MKVSGFILLLLITSCAQNPDADSQLAKMKIKGNVKMLELSKYNVEQKGKTVIKLSDKSSIYGPTYTKIEFNRAGNAQKRELRYAADKHNKKRTYLYNYYFGSNEKYKKVEVTQKQNGITSKSITKYKWYGDSLEVVTNAKSGFRIENHYKDNKITSNVHFKQMNSSNKRPIPRDKKVTSYGENDLPKELIRYYNKGDIVVDWVPIGKTVFSYDQRGNVVSRKNYNLKGKEEAMTALVYNDQDDEIKESWTQIGEGTNSTIITTYKYDYDETGNWLKKTHFKNSNPFQVFERKIIYF